MKFPFPVCLSTVLLASTLATTAQAQDKPACNVEQTRKDMVAMIDRDVRVRSNLPAVLKEAEQKMGRQLTVAESWEAATDLRQADELNRAELDRIVAACGWPTKAVLGKEPVRIAAMIMVHAPESYIDKHYDEMWASYKAGETFPLWMATVIDDKLMDQGKLQRFGTRSDSPASDGSRYAVEDPEHLEERRRAFGIPAVIRVEDE